MTIDGLTKTFPGKKPVTAIDSMELDIQEGEFLVLLGPSGCGKTTTLRCLAGLEQADEGRITLGDQVVFDGDGGVNLAPNKRDLGMVFQSYALWPHLTVEKNIAYPLKARKLRHGLAEGWVETIADAVDCRHLLQRLPGQLSGGQQQRIALARGLVARPGLVLFDEPLSNLDARLRESVRSELAELHGQLQFTAVYVTHDQSEALALGDRLVIMRDGRIEQCGTPREVFRTPASEYVAAFIGMDNRLELTPTEGCWHWEAERMGGRSSVVGDGSVTLRLLPEDIEVNLADVACTPGRVSMRARVVVAAFGGRHLDLTLAVGQQRLQARIRDDGRRNFAEGDDVVASFDPDDAAIYRGDARVADARSVFSVAEQRVEVA